VVDLGIVSCVCIVIDIWLLGQPGAYAAMPLSLLYCSGQS